MSTTRSGISSCRHCFYYQVEGRRGGTCTQLGVPVQACWQACPLAAPLFASTEQKVVGVPSCAAAFVSSAAEERAAVAASVAESLQGDRPAAEVIPISTAHHHITTHYPPVSDLQTYPTRRAPSALA
jgi:hypothetical protein